MATFRIGGAYAPLKGYLHRWRLLEAGRFMARVHHILTPDGTPFLHNHPFHYASLVLRGGYAEQVLQPDGTLRVVRRFPGHLVARRATTLHRIETVRPGGCWTLVLIWRVGGAWRLARHASVVAPADYVDASDGLYAVPGGYRKRVGGVWYALRPTPEDACCCASLSIHQVQDGNVIHLDWPNAARVCDLPPA